MKKGRWKFVIPTMVVVTIAAIYMLTNHFQDVPTNHKILIVICATIFSGILAHGLFSNEDEEKPDELTSNKPKLHYRPKKKDK